MIALKDFRYTDLGTKQQIIVQRGQEISGEVLAAHNCDVAKLERTKFVERGEGAPPKKRRVRQPR
jgi:hypothetical protein